MSLLKYNSIGHRYLVGTRGIGFWRVCLLFSCFTKLMNHARLIFLNESQHSFHYYRYSTASRSQTLSYNSNNIGALYNYNIHVHITLLPLAIHWPFIRSIRGQKKYIRRRWFRFRFARIQVTRQNITILFEWLQYNP